MSINSEQNINLSEIDLPSSFRNDDSLTMAAQQVSKVFLMMEIQHVSETSLMMEMQHVFETSLMMETQRVSESP